MPSILGKSIDMYSVHICAGVQHFGRLQIANQSINNWNENHFAGFNLSSADSHSHSQCHCHSHFQCVSLWFDYTHSYVCKWVKLCTSITGIASEPKSKWPRRHWAERWQTIDRQTGRQDERVENKLRVLRQVCAISELNCGYISYFHTRTDQIDIFNSKTYISNFKQLAF